MESGQKKKKIVVIGGGTGSFTTLTGLKQYPVELSAIVAMTDDGGSTGVLRDEYGVLPPGDLRQCLIALSEADGYMRDLFNHRFENGDFDGHSFGNIFISTLEQVTGSFEKAIECAGEILKINGTVIPVTLEDVRLYTELKNGKILEGEHALTEYQLISKFGIKKMQLKPTPKLNPKARSIIKDADVIVLGPGNFYSSLVPNLLVSGMKTALKNSPAKKVYVANLMNKHGQTDGFTTREYLSVLDSYLGEGVFDTVLYNTKQPPPYLLKRYVDEGEPVIHIEDKKDTRQYVGAPLIADTIYSPKKGDVLRRTLIRHDPKKLARAIVDLIK